MSLIVLPVRDRLVDMTDHNIITKHSLQINMIIHDNQTVNVKNQSPVFV